MIHSDTGDLVGQTFLIEEDDDGLCCRACIIAVLDDQEKNFANNPVISSSDSSVKTNLRRLFLTMKSCNTLRRTMMMVRPSGNTSESLHNKTI
jgi:hypothetical protein